MRYVVGVDAGGTATAAAAYSYEDGVLLARGGSGFGNVALDFGQALTHIQQAAAQAMEGVPGQCELLLIGAAGVETSGAAGEIARRLQKFFACPVAVETDARLALEGALAGGDGILVISGTGSFAMGRKGKALAQAGGWGHLVGDEGSGYALVAQAVRRLTLNEDLGLPEQPLSRAVRHFFQANNARETVRFLHENAKGQVAAAAPIITRFAQEGDELALALVKKASQDLAFLVACLVRRLGFSAPFPLAVQGSVLQKSNEIRAGMLAALQEKGFSCTPLPLEGVYTR